MSHSARAICFLLAIASGAMMSGCGGDHAQSVLHPAGVDAERIAWLWWFMFAVLGFVFVVVMILVFAAVRGRKIAGPEPALGNRFIIVSAVVLPSIILIVLLIFSVRATLDLGTPKAGLKIQVTGHQWWWDVYYPDSGFRTANEIYVPVGQPVLLEVTSQDVIHSFWAPNLGGKMDLIPGRVNRFSLRASKPGTFRGQCAEFCGLQHALMAFMVVALPPAEFEEWRATQTPISVEPTTPQQEHGKKVFFQAACNNCHAIRGTAAEGIIGPDLTHIGSRRTIGAGILSNNRGNLSGWIINPQALKPGNRMPPSFLAPEDLHSLVEYLQALK